MQAIDLIVTRHTIFRSRLNFNIEHGYLQQSIIELTSNEERSYPVYMSTVRNEEEFKKLGFEEFRIPLNGKVFRCHFIRYGHNDSDVLKPGDFIAFTFHHGSFDGVALQIFFNELRLSYSGNYDSQKPVLQYIDYAQYERSNVDMSVAKTYWLEALQGFSWDHQPDLPFDFGVPTNARRSGRGQFVMISIPSEITHALITRAEELNVTLMQLTLTCFYIFLAQLSPYNQDSCVAVPIRNRYRSELENVIGMFANILPCRMIFDVSPSSTLPFVQLLHQVQNNLINMMNYGNMPYSELLDLHRSPSHNLQFPFLQVYFALISSIDYEYAKNDRFNLVPSSVDENSCSLSQYDLLKDFAHENTLPISSMFDTHVTVMVDIDNKIMDLNWTYSTDLFTCTTIDMLSNQFIRLLADLFVGRPVKELHTTPLVKLISMANKPINLWINHDYVRIISIVTFSM